MPDILGVSWYGFVIVCGFIAADFLLGIARAFMQGEYKSSVLCKGLARKGAFVVVLLLAAYIEWPRPFGRRWRPSPHCRSSTPWR